MYSAFATENELGEKNNNPVGSPAARAPCRGFFCLTYTNTKRKCEKCFFRCWCFLKTRREKKAFFASSEETLSEFYSYSDMFLSMKPRLTSLFIKTEMQKAPFAFHISEKYLSRFRPYQTCFCRYSLVFRASSKKKISNVKTMAASQSSPSISVIPSAD